MLRVLSAGVSLMVGLMVGGALALSVVTDYIELTGPLEVTTVPVYRYPLTAGDSYVMQATAPVNVLEPKVSDAYLQWGGLTDEFRTGNPQPVGYQR